MKWKMKIFKFGELLLEMKNNLKFLMIKINFNFNFKSFKRKCHDDKHIVWFAVLGSNLDLMSVIVKPANENARSGATQVVSMLKWSFAIRL